MNILSQEQIEKTILIIRGHRVILDVNLAKIYGVTTKHLNQQVKRNLDRFPEDFMFQVIEIEEESLRSQIVTSKIGRGGRRYLPYVFTEHGALMLGNILNSPVAVAASIQIVRAFISLRKMLSSQAEMARKLDTLERKYDYQFKVVFDAIRELTLTPELPRKRIGINQSD
ncbi:MAG: ORF6N domain-containing protein [Bdellovibrionota bacterium]